MSRARACVPVQRARTLEFANLLPSCSIVVCALQSFVSCMAAFGITTATVTSRYLKTRETTRPHDAPARSSTVPRMSSKPTLRRAPCSMGGGPMIGSQPTPPQSSQHGHASHSHALRMAKTRARAKPSDPTAPWHVFVHSGHHAGL
jgi:hypothetical protein